MVLGSLSAVATTPHHHHHQPHGCLWCVPQGKLQKHQAFEAEVQANAGTIIKLDETGNVMISEGHFASETIRVRCTQGCSLLLTLIQ